MECATAADKFSHHTHTFIRDTSAKVTPAPASKFTHRSQGYRCACACACVTVCENSPLGHDWFDMSSISHLLSILTTMHQLSCLFLLFLHIFCPTRPTFFISFYPLELPLSSSPLHLSRTVFLCPLLSPSYTLCSLLAVIN